ncbi:uncharacterized PE-PGRS family protein PE_PGRS54-like [Capsicum annuum]|uniref:uncharacterized PE-PGRS family protein PE_PGRS54-like n=1 Tax=Capsicum annuum TaxID=4072 RepID=UPI001FB06BA9|nr:uncharacterized PE-PGRS family protein PE_PGRS54-like [Capsicum annuum]
MELVTRGKEERVPSSAGVLDIVGRGRGSQAPDTNGESGLGHTGERRGVPSSAPGERRGVTGSGIGGNEGVPGSGMGGKEGSRARAELVIRGKGDRVPELRRSLGHVGGRDAEGKSGLGLVRSLGHGGEGAVLGSGGACDTGEGEWSWARARGVTGSGGAQHEARESGSRAWVEFGTQWGGEGVSWARAEPGQFRALAHEG